MKIEELKDKQKNVHMDVKIIWDEAKPQHKFGKLIKTVIVVDADNEESKPSAYLDLYNDDATKYKFQDKIRIVDGYAKQMNSGQFIITNPSTIQKLE